MENNLDKNIEICFLLKVNIFSGINFFSDLFPNSPKTAFTMKPKIGDKEAYNLGFMGQAATDINGKSDLPNLLKPYGGSSSAYANDQLFTNAKDAGTGGIIYNALKDFQTPYRLDKADYNSSGKEMTLRDKLNPYIEKQKQIKESGGKISVAAENTLALEGLNPIDNYFGNKEVQTGKDKAGSTNVEKTFGDDIKAMAPSKAVDDFIKFYKDTKNNPNISNNESVKTITDRYNEMKKTLTTDEKKTLSYWVTTSPNANIMSQLNPKTRGLVMRVKPIINDTPEIAKAYWSAHAKFQAPKEGTGGSNKSFFLGFEHLRDGKGGPGKIDETSKLKEGEFIIIRHGATKNNEDGLNRGMLNLELSPEGRKEAEHISSRVAKKEPTGIIVSPLLRAQQTAKIISKETGIPVLETNKALLPWAIGEFQGKSIKDTLPELHRYMDNPDKAIPGGGESFNQFKERTLTGLKDIEKRYPNEKLALISHHRVERLIEACANEINGHGNFAIETQKEAGIQPSDFREHKWDHLFPPSKDGKGGPGKYSSLTPKAVPYPQPVSKQLKVKYGGVVGAVKKGMGTSI